MEELKEEWKAFNSMKQMWDKSKTGGGRRKDRE